MPSNPLGYGEAVYDKPQDAKKEDKTPFVRGELVIWTRKRLHAAVLNDWKDYGVQISVEDGRGITTNHRVAREDLTRGVTVLDILSRI
jgi:hypothetical protein